MENKTYLVYVKILENGYISAVNSSAFLIDIDGWINIDKGFGDKYYHAQGNYFDKPIRTDIGAYRYKYVDGVVGEIPDEEIIQQEDLIIAKIAEPSQLDRIESQVAYLAMMTGNSDILEV